MFRRLFILAAVVSLGLPAVRAQEGAASHAAVIQADTLPALLERLERDPEDIDLLVEICSQYTMRSEFAAIHPYVSRLRRAGAAHDDERALMYADLFSGQSYLLAEGSDSTRIYLDRALIRGRQCEDPVALCRIYNALGIYAGLTVCNSMLLSRCNDYAPFHLARAVLADVFGCMLGYSVVLCGFACLREYLQRGSVWNTNVGTYIAADKGTALPFFGFLLLGFAAALAKWADSRRNKKTERQVPRA